ncbi:MAG: hypothetical protein IJ736_11835, partial [Firmicutes bacterium]|nr:hypothetical protein [Bacillota bacterium]
MICKAEHIERPYSGEYRERIYDIESCWNSSFWCWVKFYEEDDEVWCGNFRGDYRGSAISDKLGIVVVLTSDYMFILDKKTGDIIEYSSDYYSDIIRTPFDDLILIDDRCIYIFTDEKISGIRDIELPFWADDLSFVGIDDDILKLCCYRDYEFEKNTEV